MKKLLLVAMLTLALLLVVVACQNETPQSSTEAASTEPQFPATVEPNVTTAEPDVTTVEPEVTAVEPEVTTAEPEVTTAEPEELTSEPDNSEIEFTPFEDLFHANIDFINGASKKGVGIPYTGLCSSSIIGNGEIMVCNAIDDGIVVNEDYTINLKGWMAVLGGINRYVYCVNDGEYIDAPGGADGEPVAGHYNGLGMPNSLKNGLFNTNLIVADLSAYVGQTVTVSFYAVPQKEKNTLAPILRIEGLVVSTNQTETDPVEPETDPVEPETPGYPAWNADCAVVTHQSFDQLYIGTEGGAGPHNIFTPGQAAAWDKIATVDSSAEYLTYWGWIGIKGEVGQFGYQIDDNAAIFDDAFTFPTEPGVINAAAPTGSDTASRMKIMMNLNALDAGEHTVYVLYKNPNGDTVALNVFTLVKNAPVEPEPEPEPEIPSYPLWSTDKAVVTHQSYEWLRATSNGGETTQNIYASGLTWRNILTVDTSVESLIYFGWVGIKGSVGQFGYQIDGNEAVFSDKFIYPTEPGVINAAAPTGSDTASRMIITIDLNGLDSGEYTVNVLYKNPDGIIVALNTFTLVVIVPPTGAPVYPVWSADKAIVTHQSFDQLYTGTTGGAGPHNIFDPGKVANWNGIANISSDVTELSYWGWIGIKGEVGQFGYQIDDNAAIFDDAFTFTTEQAVINAAAPTGSDTASRMKVVINVNGLDEGVHTVNVLYKNPNGDIVALYTFILVK